MLRPQKIVNIRKVGLLPAMDLEIDSNDHLFLADGCVVSNSHAVAYAFIGYICQYLKNHYPLEWWCSVFKNERDNDKLAEMYNLFQDVLVMPEINESKGHFYIKDNKIVIPLNYIMRVGGKAVDEIVSNQPFNSLKDLVNRTNRGLVRKDIVINLIFAGVFRNLEKKKGKDLLESYFYLLNDGFKVGSAPSKKLLEEFRSKYRNLTRFDLLKLTNNILPGVCENYLDFFKDLLPDNIKKIGWIFSSKKSSTPVVTGGLVKSVREHATKKGDTMAFVTIEDGESDISVLLWPNKYEQYKGLLKEKDLVVVNGTTNYWGEKFSVIANKINVIEK